MTFKKGKPAWNKGLTGKEYKAHYKNGFSGTFEEGSVPHNKGIKGWMQGHIGYMLGKKHSKETKRKMSKAKKNFIPWNKGKICPQISGANKPNWKGGVTFIAMQIRKHFLYRQWRSDIFTRDEFTCQECNQRGGRLHAHHIKTFSSILQFYEITTLNEALECEELFNINNGVTLCKKCHKKLHKIEKQKLTNLITQ